jgi:PBP1b-binding outer membrane lipoprotein LpoB
MQKLVKSGIVLLAVGLMLMGCAGENAGTNAADEASEKRAAPTETTDEPTPPASTSESSEPQPEVVPVSMATACDLLGADKVITGSMDVMQEFVNNPDLSKTEPEELRRVIRDIEDVRVRAPEKLALQLGATSLPFEQLLEIVETQKNQSVDLQGFRAAGLEMIRLCGPALLS